MPTIERLKPKFFITLNRPGLKSVVIGFRNKLFGVGLTAGVRYRFEKNIGITAHTVNDKFINGPSWTAASLDFSILGIGGLLEFGVITGKRQPLQFEIVTEPPIAPVKEPSPADSVSDPIIDNGIIQS